MKPFLSSQNLWLVWTFSIYQSFSTTAKSGEEPGRQVAVRKGRRKLRKKPAADARIELLSHFSN